MTTLVSSSMGISGRGSGGVAVQVCGGIIQQLSQLGNLVDGEVVAEELGGGVAHRPAHGARRRAGLAGDGVLSKSVTCCHWG